MVNDEFPIKQAGILGSDFFRTHKAIINYTEECVDFKNKRLYFNSRETIIIPARTNISFHVNINNTDLTEGYLPRLDAGEVFIGEALVKNVNGRAQTRVINTTD